MLRHLLIIACAFLCGFAHAAGQDDDFLAAREAARVGDSRKLGLIAPRLAGYVLEPYVAYWQVRLRLEEASPDEVRGQIARLADGPLADRLRIDWLKVVGRRGQWELFDTEYPALVAEDADVACYAIQRRIALQDTGALREARPLWFSGRDTPDACAPVFDALMRAGLIASADVWARIRLALEAGQVGLAKRVAEHLPAADGFDARAIDAAAANPQAFLERKAPAARTRGARETQLFAVHRLARTAPQQAAALWRGMAESFSPEERGYAWGQLAYYGAMRHDPEALAWFARAGALSDLQLAWKVRAALRARQWTEVAAAIQAMSEREQRDPAWRYWKARVLRVQGNPAAANAILVPLSAEHHFYGLLAAEELGPVVGPAAEGYRPAEDEVQAAAQTPALRRALAFYRLGLRFEGNREWIWAIRDLDDRQLLAVAELARRNELWDRAINTADRTRQTHDFAMRYLAPYREQFRSFAREQGLDEAWVLGLVRQESRFIADARSSAGARGLMQLMPATAQWVAKKMGMKDYRLAAVTDLDINISLGTYYLKHVLETLDNHPVLASAAYNAGPGRARAWRTEESMDAAVYAESIPFNETRDYVKKVMANATYYAYTLGQGLTSLRQRIGVIPPRSGVRAAAAQQGAQ